MVAVSLLLVALFPQRSNAQIPNGFEVVRITNDTDGEWRPSINNCGQIVYSKRIDQSEDAEEIFLFDNGTTARITDDNIRDAFPDINDNGAIVYTHRANGPEGGIVTTYRNGTAEELFPGASVVINNRNRLSWKRRTNQGCRSADYNIFWYDGETVEQITENDHSNQSAQINDEDWIAWDRLNFCDDPWTSDILLYDGEETVEMESDAVTPRGATINNVGQVAWGGHGGLELWDNGQIALLSDWGDGPELNDSGSMYFIRWHDDEETWNSWLYEDGRFFQLTDAPTWDVDGDINNDGETVWGSFDVREWPIKSDIYYMRRIRTGDSEFDGDIDIDDLAKLVDCMTGPMWVERTNPGAEDSLCECRFLDINHDGSVDLRDYAMFQVNYAK